MANEYDGFISTGFDKIGEDFFKDLNGKLKNYCSGWSWL